MNILSRLLAPVVLTLGLFILASGIAGNALALDSQSRTLTYVYGTGWAVDDGWLNPMTENAADAVVALENAQKNKAVCDVKGVFKSAEWNQSVLDFLAYSITNCQ